MVRTPKSVFLRINSSERISNRLKRNLRIIPSNRWLTYTLTLWQSPKDIPLSLEIQGGLKKSQRKKFLFSIVILINRPKKMSILVKKILILCLLLMKGRHSMESHSSTKAPQLLISPWRITLKCTKVNPRNQIFNRNASRKTLETSNAKSVL